MFENQFCSEVTIFIINYSLTRDVQIPQGHTVCMNFLKVLTSCNVV